MILLLQEKLQHHSERLDRAHISNESMHIAQGSTLLFACFCCVLLLLLLSLFLKYEGTELHRLSLSLVQLCNRIFFIILLFLHTHRHTHMQCNIALAFSLHTFLCTLGTLEKGGFWKWVESVSLCGSAWPAFYSPTFGWWAIRPTEYTWICRVTHSHTQAQT